MSSGILVIDKREDWTSHDVVAKLRGILKERRIGHGGTLDPMATGVLVVFVGRATRAAGYLTGDKTYLADFRTGYVTDTYDSTGNIVSGDGEVPEIERIVEILPRFMGDILQAPPMVSAVKINGQRLYKLARQGITVERKARPVRISELTWLGIGHMGFRLKITCSAGTYIRSIIHDLGVALGCGAYMTALRRIAASPFTIEEAIPIECAASDKLLSVDTLFNELPKLIVSAKAEQKLRCGAVINSNGKDGLLRVYGTSGDFLLLGRRHNSLLTVEKSFFEPR